MFGRLANVKIKSAEDALAAGRIDEAFVLATADDLAKHERIVKVRESLASAFLERGQERLMSRQFTEAIADFDRAARCGFMADKVKEWRRRGQDAYDADRASSAERQAALEEARRRAEAGSLAGAADALNRTPSNDPLRGAMEAALDRQARQAADALGAAESAIERDDLHTAAKQITAAKRLHSKLEGLASAEARLVDRTVERARGHFESGRLDRARMDLELLSELESRRSERIEIENAIRHAVEASIAFAAHDYSKAAVCLGRVAKVYAKAEWVAEARERLARVEESVEFLMEGPLGLLAHAKGVTGAQADRAELNETLAAPKAPPPPIARPTAPPAYAANEARPGDTPGVPRRMLLRIDGVGSFLLVRGDRISIGRAGPGATADVALVSDLSERQADIVRAGEDYFVVSQSGVELAGANTDHALLQDGDRIRLGKRIRLRFRRPSLKSSAALLDMGDGVRMENDCRRVVLWSGPVLIGGTKECHVTTPQSAEEYVLIERGGRIYVKPMGPRGQATPIEFGQAVTLGDLRFTVNPVSGSGRAGRVMG